MDQVLHILGKDIRRLRWEIAATLLATAMLAWLNGDNSLVSPGGRRAVSLSGLQRILTLLAPAAWWFLLVSLIHEEALPGIRQFWLTRPYRRSALLGAKLLFIALFLNLPALLADLAVMARSGAPLSGQWGALFWKQVPYSAIFLMPALALAAVTSSVMQTILGLLGLVVLNSLLFITLHSAGFTLAGGLGWWVFAFLMLLVMSGGPVLLCWQYFRRSTARSRLLILALNTAFLAGPAVVPWRTVFAWQQRLAHQPGAGAGYAVNPALERGRQTTAESRSRTTPESAWMALPVEQTVPPGLEASNEGIEIAMHLPDGRPVEAVAGWIEREGKAWIGVAVARERFLEVRDRPLGITVTLYATLFGDARHASTGFGAAPRFLPAMGVCGSADQGHSAIVWCRAAFRPAYGRGFG